MTGETRPQATRTPATAHRWRERSSSGALITSGHPHRIFTAPEAAPVSIVGPPRVGKSSLARQVLDQFAIGASPSGLTFVPVWITVSGAVSEQSLFRELALLILDQLDECGLPADRLQAPYAALTAAVGWDQMCMCLKTFLRQVRRAGYQVVAVLDEFDAARTVFHRAAPFQYLRAIAYDPKVGVALITASRRPLSEIVVKSTAEVSNFPQIFGSPLTLGCFDGPELSALIARSPFDNDLRMPCSAGWTWRPEDSPSWPRRCCRPCTSGGWPTACLTAGSLTVSSRTRSPPAASSRWTTMRRLWNCSGRRTGSASCSRCSSARRRP